jgi:hypothetical protein
MEITFIAITSILAKEDMKVGNKSGCPTRVLSTSIVH